MEERESEEVPNREDPSESEGGDEDEEDCEQPSKKKKKVNVPRQWNEVNRWNREDHALQDIKAFIRAELDDLNRSAGILHVPGAHKDRNNEYGDFQFRRQWITRDRVEHFLYACPLRQRCKCQCEAKISHFPTAIILYVSKQHTAHDHVCERDSGKYLTFQQKSFIANAVKVAPLQTGSELIRNVQDSPTKAIDHKYKGSVDRLVRKQREQIVNVSLDGVVIDNTLGSLCRLANAIWIVDALEDHKQGVRCLDLFKVYCIGKQIMGSDRTVFLTFATGYNILNLWRAVGTGYDVQLHGDVTGKASTLALSKLAFGVNMLGAHYAPLSTSLIHADSESSGAYVQAYRALKNAVRYFICIKLCDDHRCTTCWCIQEVREMPKVVAAITDPAYTGADKLLPIARPMGDNSAAWQKFAKEELHLESNVCQTHATAIAANNGSHKKHFDDPNKNYDGFYEFVCRIMRCSFAEVGEHLQTLLVDWLRSVREGRAAEWFQTWWCGPVKGRWLLGHGGVAMSGNNQGLESKWRWDSEAISHGRQVSGMSVAKMCDEDGSLLTRYSPQMNLGLYMANLFKVMKSGSLQLQADLSIAGHPNKFPLIPTATKFDWDLLQDMDYRTLLCTHCHTGNPPAWQRGIAAIYAADVHDTRSLLLSRAQTHRTIHPTTDAKVLLMPTRKLMTLVLAQDPEIDDAALIEAVRGHAAQYVEYYVQGRGRVLTRYSLEQALTLYESFHILESQDPRWSDDHLFKCNCQEFFKRASCSHCLAAGMACDASITLPGEYHGDTVQQRRKRGRPTAKSTELGDEGEVRARDRIALQKQYVPPKVMCVHCTLISQPPDTAGDRKGFVPK